MSNQVTRVDDSQEMGITAPSEGTMAIATTRASQEVQAAMIIAKKFPRDETAAIAKIQQACKRRGLAEASMYSYPKGGSTIEGPSIRLAEAMAQNWGNIDFGIIELDQKNGESNVMAYAWDLETNSRQTKIFTVPHKRYTKSGSYPLTDPREIYETVANNGARRLRACILGIIPGDVQDLAIAQCNTTLQAGHKEPLIDRVRAMLAAFAEMGVTQPMIEARVQHKADLLNETEMVGLQKVYRTLRDNMGKREDFFEVNAGQGEGSRSQNLVDKLKGKPAEPAKEVVKDSPAPQEPAKEEAKAPVKEDPPKAADAPVVKQEPVQEAMKTETVKVNRRPRSTSAPAEVKIPTDEEAMAAAEVFANAKTTEQSKAWLLKVKNAHEAEYNKAVAEAGLKNLSEQRDGKPATDQDINNALFNLAVYILKKGIALQ